MSTITPGPIGPATTAKRGTMSAADKAKLDGYPATPGTGAVSSVTQANGLTLTAGDLTLTQAPVTLDGASSSWLTLVGQMLKLTLVSAAGATAGLVDDAAQAWNGVKTFAAEAVFSAGLVATGVRAIGAALMLRSDLGAGASDVGVDLGFSTANGSVNIGAKAVRIGAGVGGTFIEYVSFGKSLTVFTSNGVEVGRISSGVGFSGSLAAYYAFYVSQVAGGYGAVNSVRLTTEGADGAASVAGLINTTTAWSNATSRLWSFRTNNVEKSAIMSNGEFEHAVAGAGIVLKSPDGTRYRLTVANGGTLSIAAA